MSQIAEAAALVAALERADAELARRQRYKFYRMFPDCLPGCVEGSPNPDDHVIRPGNLTPICRVLYPKHMRFMVAPFPSRLFMAGNRVGKTEVGAFEVVSHMTGDYKPWWKGRRFEGPVDVWAAGSTSKTTRDIMQVSLLGDLGREPEGLGMIPLHLIADKTPKAGVPDAFETVWVKHVERVHGAPALSMLQFKSYDQGRRAFDGTAKDVIWLDEEAHEDVISECGIRTMTKSGIVMLTFTPLQGMTPVVKSYIESAVIDDGVGSYTLARDTFFAPAESE